MTPEHWLVVATSVLVAVTAVYVVVSGLILKANKKAVKVMQEQHKASLRPYIVPSTFLVPGNYMVSLQISNMGKSAAEDLQLSLDKDYYPPREKEEDERSLRNAYIFQNKITTFAPGERRVFYLGTGKDIFEDASSRRPYQFAITATYSFSGKTISEQTVIDLETYRESQLQPQDAVVRELTRSHPKTLRRRITIQPS
jgi:hypothetical protein